MGSFHLLRRFIRESITGLRHPKGQRRLRVFDFDDTLVKTAAMVHVTSASGERFDLTPAQYATYVPHPGDEMDYSDFSEVKDPQEVQWITRILRRVVATGGAAVVLTARSRGRPIETFLDELGLRGVEVVALGDAEPQRKADYIAGRIERDGFDYVEFFDDSHKNVEAVRSLSGRYPDVKVVARHVTHGASGIS